MLAALPVLFARATSSGDEAIATLIWYGLTLLLVLGIGATVLSVACRIVGVEAPEFGPCMGIVLTAGIACNVASGGLLALMLLFRGFTDFGNAARLQAAISDLLWPVTLLGVLYVPALTAWIYSVMLRCSFLRGPWSG